MKCCAIVYEDLRTSVQYKTPHYCNKSGYKYYELSHDGVINLIALCKDHAVGLDCNVSTWDSKFKGNWSTVGLSFKRFRPVTAVREVDRKHVESDKHDKKKRQHIDEFKQILLYKKNQGHTEEYWNEILELAMHEILVSSVMNS